MQKLYCYVDESGQDTKGKIFLVFVIILDKEREEIKKKLEEIEEKSGKRTRKWYKTNNERRLNYIEKIIISDFLKGKIFYSKYENTKAYIDLAVLTVAKAILKNAKDSYKATILVDGLKKTERHYFTYGLKKLKIKVRKVRGIKDENDPFIRLADAICGFIRDSLGENLKFKDLSKDALNKKIIENI